VYVTFRRRCFVTKYRYRVRYFVTKYLYDVQVQVRRGTSTGVGTGCLGTGTGVGTRYRYRYRYSRTAKGREGTDGHACSAKTCTYHQVCLIHTYMPHKYIHTYYLRHTTKYIHTYILLASYILLRLLICWYVAMADSLQRGTSSRWCSRTATACASSSSHSRHRQRSSLLSLLCSVSKIKQKT
jgi:hypothetical protein